MAEWPDSMDRALLFLLILAGVLLVMALSGKWLRARRGRPRANPDSR
jgi:hypothetical protein